MKAKSSVSTGKLTRVDYMQERTLDCTAVRLNASKNALLYDRQKLCRHSPHLYTNPDTEVKEPHNRDT